MATSIPHKGQQFRHRTESSWPTIMVGSVHESPTATYAGKPLAPFAFVTFADDPDHQVAMDLAVIARDWEDTGV